MSQYLNTVQVQSVKSTKPAERLSKKERARRLYVQLHNLPREQLIQKFIEDLDMPENSARTYVSICAKELNEGLGKDYKTRKVNRVGSKRERAFQIFSDNATLSRKEIIEKLCAELNMTHNSAATHCSLASKKYRIDNPYFDAKIE